MKVLIIYAHPYEKSFNHALLDTLIEGLKSNDVKIIDLNKEEFNPVFKKEELALYRKGQSLDNKVKEYQSLLEWANCLILLFPLWWGSMPAVLKGFIDKVFLPGWAYEKSKFGLIKGKLTNIKKAIIIHTMNTPGFYFKFIFKNPIKQILAKDVLKNCGIKNVKLFQFGSIVSVKDKIRKDYLTKISEYVIKIK
jgi:NAD(P)H dehydrogenase (quinone)